MSEEKAGAALPTPPTLFTSQSGGVRTRQAAKRQEFEFEGFMDDMERERQRWYVEKEAHRLGKGDEGYER